MRRALGFKLTAQARRPDELRRLLRAASAGRTSAPTRRWRGRSATPRSRDDVVVGAPADGGADLRPAPVRRSTRPPRCRRSMRCPRSTGGSRLTLFTRGDPAAAAGCGRVDARRCGRDLPVPARLARRQRHADRGGVPTRPGRRRPARGVDHHPGLQVRQIPASPVHASTVAALAATPPVRDRPPAPGCTAFFVSTRGTRLSPNLHHTFAGAVVGRGDPGTAPGARRPRCTTCGTPSPSRPCWTGTATAATSQARLPLLSTYLGHVDPKSTYWYLQATPELLALAAARLENTTVPR